MKKMNGTKQRQTLIGSIEQIVNLVVEHKLSDEFYAVADEHLTYLAERMNLTAKQALLFALFIERSSAYRITVRSFADMIECRVVRVISIMGEVDALIDRGLVRRRKDDDGEVTYRVPFEVVEAVKDDRLYEPKPAKGLNLEQFYDKLEDIFEKNDFDEAEERDVALRELIANNQQLPICQVIKQLGLPSDREYSMILLCAFIHFFINKNDDCVAVHDWEDYIPTKYLIRRICSAFKSKKHILVTKNVLEPRNADGMGDSDFFHLTDSAKVELFPDLEIESKSADKAHLIPHDSFAEKRLFYNTRVQQQVDQLYSLLQPDNFQQVQNRLAENGMRKGFACLFYGAPGTGKTETVNQLARMTGRDVMMVDVSQIKSCWVGESEKNIKEAFDRYRKSVKCAEIAPILLFNEADAVLGIRQEGAERAVDKMENSIQNIILQEMEKLDGIMIATTNLTQNLDKAFERRFIYKIEFERPSVEARSAIWQTMIPDMDRQTADALAAQFDFSGGQIENIARKRTVELILGGAEPTIEQLSDYCRAEILSTRAKEYRRVGF